MSPRLPRTIWALGLVSLFMDVSSETIHALLPLFLTTTLGASVAFVGLVDGIAESTASIGKVFSGYLSDRIGRRKPLMIAGYGLAAITKPLFALASGPLFVLGARFLDRIGKGVREAPRDALIADVTPDSSRGRAYGLRQALDTVGAVGGPMLGIGLMALFADNMRAVFWIAAIPAAIAAAILVLCVRDPNDGGTQSRVPIRLSDLSRMPLGFWTLTLIGVAFSFARFSEAFLVLKAHDDGLSIMLAPIVYVVMNAVYALGAYPIGAFADRTDPRRLLLAGMGALVAADLVLGLAPSLVGALVGICLWGAHLALTQGVFAKLVADAAPKALRASAFGVFNLLSGLALLLASVLAGLVWDQAGGGVTFLVGAGFSLIAAIGLLTASQRPSQS